MANIKADLVNELRNQKYYAELELVRLAQEPAMNYKEKITLLTSVLGDLATINNKVALVDAYFQEAPAPQQPMANALPQAPALTPVHQGQTHGE